MSGLPVQIAVMGQSHSSMSCFTTCPRQYEARYITKETKFEQSAEAAWGDAVHKALELRIKIEQPLPSNMAMYDKWAKAILAQGGEKIPEGAFGITSMLTPCGFFDPNVWLRSKIDLLVIDGELAKVLDYKTGKMKQDIAQLRRYAVMVFVNFPQVQTVKAGYVWLRDGVLSVPVVFKREDLDKLVLPDKQVYDEIRAAYASGKFIPRPSGLCNGWCQVTRCEFWKPKR